MNSIFQLGSGRLIATAFAGGLLCMTLVSPDLQFGIYSASNTSANSGTSSDVPGTSASGGDSKSGTTDVGADKSGTGAE